MMVYENLNAPKKNNNNKNTKMMEKKKMVSTKDGSKQESVNLTK